MLLSLLPLLSCSKVDSLPTVGVFIQQKTSWDEILLNEIRSAASIYDKVAYSYNISSCPTEQADQIDRAVKEGAKAVIVRAMDVDNVLPAVERAYDSGIYVVLVDNPLPTKKFHSFAGMNNRELGIQAGHIVESLLPHGGNVIELGAPSFEMGVNDRTKGFHSVLVPNESINIVASVECNWTQATTGAALDSLKNSLKDTHVDLIFSNSDDILLGAIKSDSFQDAIYIGTDSTVGESIQYVSSGEIACSILAQTGGYEAVSLASDLISGIACGKYNYCTPVIINSLNADAVALSLNKINYFAKKTTDLKSQLDVTKVRLDHYIPAAYIAIFLIIVNLILYVIAKIYKRRHRRVSERVIAAEMHLSELNSKTEAIELQRQKLESERNALLDAATSLSSTAPDAASPSSNDSMLFNRFKASVEKHYSDPSFSIEDIAMELGISRAQLFRKLKAQTGETPNDLLQSMRLKKADELLQTTDLTISEIAYATGFSSPSYFTKCYRDKFGRLPSAGKITPTCLAK